MHLWPSKNLRDSFKLSYLKKLEWNYSRMERDKQQKQEQQQQQQQKLLDEVDSAADNTPDNLKSEAGSIASICHDLLLVLSCCYCCFCCGVLFTVGAEVIDVGLDEC